MSINLQWDGKMGFAGDAPSGARIVLDAHPESGGSGTGPTPVEALLASVAACSAMDVISILQKKRQEVTSYTVEVEHERAPEGEWPRPITKFSIRHIVTGPNVDPEAVARSIQLSDEKYCTVMATLRLSPPIESTFEVRS